MSGIFISGGLSAFREPQARAPKAEAIGLPEPELMVRANGAAMVAGGVAFALGILPRAAALGLIASLVPTTLAGHPFWQEEDEKSRATQRTQFYKNLGLVGGLLLYLSKDR
jgi:putative oxidoreductase